MADTGRPAADDTVVHVGGASPYDVVIGHDLADRLPDLLGDSVQRVALLHAGWRGTAAGILERGLERLLHAAGAVPSDAIKHFGVANCGQCD